MPFVQLPFALFAFTGFRLCYGICLLIRLSDSSCGLQG
jgi:hypothetical protein